MSSRYTSAPEAWSFLNFYQEADRYPGYGIVIYDSGPPNGKQYQDEELLADSLRLCRSEYSSAYLAGNLKHWDNQGNQFVPMQLEFIAVMVIPSRGKFDAGRWGRLSCIQGL